jgi:hypothetical protein
MYDLYFRVYLGFEKNRFNLSLDEINSDFYNLSVLKFKKWCYQFYSWVQNLGKVNFMWK